MKVTHPNGTGQIEISIIWWISITHNVMWNLAQKRQTSWFYKRHKKAHFRGEDGHVSSLHCLFYRCNWGESTWIFMFCLLNQNTNHRNQSTCSKLGSLDNINNHQAIELLWVWLSTYLHSMGQSICNVFALDCALFDEFMFAPPTMYWQQAYMHLQGFQTSKHPA